ncbi:hypothetical protein CEV32_1492 [Brucella rhizosphaerae]|uniref:Uncharacterized protein n=1 Tax=Brucella rhizosphaerae TaxID=571254 RepID=A0A256F8M5_9HYPH|nr:hypothetical protein CEV32_1492 [Brucella rhizosphaerae]
MIEIAGYNGIPETEYVFNLPTISTSTLEKLVFDVGAIDPRFSESISGVLEVALGMTDSLDFIIDNSVLLNNEENNLKIKTMWTLISHRANGWKDKVESMAKKCRSQ